MEIDEMERREERIQNIGRRKGTAVIPTLCVTIQTEISYIYISTLPT